MDSTIPAEVIERLKVKLTNSDRRNYLPRLSTSLFNDFISS